MRNNDGRERVAAVGILCQACEGKNHETLNSQELKLDNIIWQKKLPHTGIEIPISFYQKPFLS